MNIQQQNSTKQSQMIQELISSWDGRPYGHKRHGPKRGRLCPFPGGGGSWDLTQCGLAEIYLRTKWHLDPSSCLATTDMGRKLGAVPLWARAGSSPSNTISPGPTSTSLPSDILIHAAIWPQQTWAKNYRAAVPLFREGAGSPRNTMWPGPRPTPVPSGILIHAAVWAKIRGAVPPFWGERGPHLTQCCLGRGLLPY